MDFAEKGTKLTPLHWAAQSGWEDAARYLIAAGPDRGAEDVNGNTPQHHANAHGHAGLAEVLAP